MKKYCLLAVEGYHDQAAIGKMLELSGFEKFDGKYDKDKREDKFDRFWEGFVPTYPRTGGSLYTRLDMPSIFTSQTHSVAIYYRSSGFELKNTLMVLSIQRLNNLLRQSLNNTLWIRRSQVQSNMSCASLNI